jgi:hypothetical protein
LTSGLDENFPTTDAYDRNKNGFSASINIVRDFNDDYGISAETAFSLLHFTAPMSR